MLYVVASLVLVGMVLGVVLPLSRRGGGPTPSTATGVVSTNSSSTNAPTFLPTGSPSTATGVVLLVESNKPTVSDGVAGDEFGYSVAIDGDALVVGAYGVGDNGFKSGSAYVFIRSTGTSTWTEQAKLSASANAAGDRFGISVAIDGDTQSW